MLDGLEYPTLFGFACAFPLPLCLHLGFWELLRSCTTSACSLGPFIMPIWMSLYCSFVKSLIDFDNEATVQVNLVVNLLEWNVETNTLYYGPSFSMIARINCFSSLDFSITQSFNSRRRDFNSVKKSCKLSKFFESKDFSSTSIKWPLISFFLPKSPSKMVQISFGVFHALMWNHRLGDTDTHRRS